MRWIQDRYYNEVILINTNNVLRSDGYYGKASLFIRSTVKLLRYGDVRGMHSVLNDCND